MILAGVGTAWLAQRIRLAAPVAPVLAVALLLLNLLPFYRAETVPRWDRAATALAPMLAAGADLYTDDGAIPMMLRAYLPGGDAALPKSRVLRQIGEAQAQLRAGAHVIAVHGPTGQAIFGPLSRFRDELQPLGTPKEQIGVGQEIVLIRFDPIPASESLDAESNVRTNP